MLKNIILSLLKSTSLLALSIFLISFSINPVLASAPFDCNSFKPFPNYRGEANGWAIRYCKQILSNTLYEIEDAFTKLEKYANHRNAKSGPIAENFPNELAKLKEVKERRIAALREWSKTGRQLMTCLKEYLLDGNNYNSCDNTPWACTVVAFWNPSSPTLCGNCEEQTGFRLEEKQFIPIISKIITGNPLIAESATICSKATGEQFIESLDKAKKSFQVDQEEQEAYLKYIETVFRIEASQYLSEFLDRINETLE